MKLKTRQRYDPNYTVTPSNATSPINDGLSDYKDTDYVGNIIYEKVKSGSVITNKMRILVDGGYIEDGVYHYYLNDHLGNNRVVANASGTVIQSNQYYPFGMSFADTPMAEQGKQPYKYNGKELDMMHGLNLYDYLARYLALDVPRFTTVDPLAEKYYSISPYAYCGNNPIKFIDPDGKEYGPPLTWWMPFGPTQAETVGKVAATILNMSDLQDAFVLVTALTEPITGKPAATFEINFNNLTPSITFNNTTQDDIQAAEGSLLIPGVSGNAVKKVDKIENCVERVEDTSRAARREVMRDAGIPTSQPLHQDKSTKSSDKVYLTRDKQHTVQDAKNDISHQGQPHREAGPTKKDPNSPDGLNRSGNNNKPQMAKPKSKVYYQMNKKSKLDILKRKHIGENISEKYKLIMERLAPYFLLDLEESDLIIEKLSNITYPYSKNEFVKRKNIQDFVNSDILKNVYDELLCSSRCFVFTDDYLYCGICLTDTKKAIKKCLQIAQEDNVNTCFLLDSDFLFYIIVNYYDEFHNDYPEYFDIQMRNY